jgi:hypothetical protein
MCDAYDFLRDAKVQGIYRQGYNMPPIGEA